MGPIPPPEEQAAIARYLTHKDALIHRFLQGKQRMLDLLKQLRKSTIHYAVIHGLDPKNTPMKPSGIPWIGDIPEHWETIPNRVLFVHINDRGYPDEQMLSITIDRGVVLQKDFLEDAQRKDISMLDKSTYKLVQPRDIAYNKMRAWQGAVGMSKYRGIVSPAYVVHRAKDRANPAYFHYLFRTSAFAAEAQRWSYGIASDMWSLRPQHFKRIYSCVPPLEEQAAIAEYLDDKVAKIDAAIAVTIRIIDQMRQYRKSLIHEVVTGVRDVRKAAAAIPDDPDDSDA